MNEYVDELVGMEHIDAQPVFFWLRDFVQFVAADETLSNLSFYQQFKIFFSDPIFFELYKDSIVLDDNGKITASRTYVYMNNVDQNDANNVVKLL